MLRISTFFIALCMVLIAASLGYLLFTLLSLTPIEAGIVSLSVLAFLILFGTITARMRDRRDVSGEIAELSRGNAHVAQRVAELERRLSGIEGKVVSATSANQDRVQGVLGEINELGSLVRQLAASVAGHDDLLAAGWRAPASYSQDASAPSITIASSPPPPAMSLASTRRDSETLKLVRSAVDDGRIDIHLQPIVTLPQRKVRFYEAVTRLRDTNNALITPDEFLETADAGGLMGRIDHAVILRCMQVLRRLMVRNKDIGIFCNMAAATLRDSDTFRQCLDFLDANRALSGSFILEIKQNTLRTMGSAEAANLATLAQRGFRFSIDHVTDLRLEPRDLAERGIRFIKVPASLLLDVRHARASDIDAADLSDLLGRHGIDLIAERIEGERAVVDLLDYDVRFGQGFLFAPPRPLRPDAGSATPEPAIVPPPPPQGSNGSASDLSRSDPPRISGNAALARRALGPG